MIIRPTNNKHRIQKEIQEFKTMQTFGVSGNGL